MAWQIGIDEAGYGPNLGPFVMTLVAVRGPSADDDPWDLLRACVRRHGERDDGRLLVADSKLVYSPARGLAALERAALAALAGGFLTTAPALHELLDRLCPDDVPKLRDECWYAGTSPLPLQTAAEALADLTERLRDASTAAGVRWGLCRSHVVCPPRFNDLIDRWDSKAVVPSLGLIHLVRACVAALPGEPLHFVIDKQGGRNQYSDVLYEAFPGGAVLAEAEGRDRSVYRVEDLGRPVRVVFTPRADAGHFPVALASIVSKYLREALMGEFNAFWRRHVPDLAPTAGYPGDAARFYAAIRPALERLGLSERQVWRRR